MLNWHPACSSPRITVASSLNGKSIPTCDACGGAAPLDDPAITSRENHIHIPPDPLPHQRNLHWPTSVQYAIAQPNEARSKHTNPAQDPRLQAESKIPAASTETSASPYSSTLEGNQIRLLELYAGSPGDPLHIRLKTISFQIGIEYEAVSYTWANDDGDFRKKDYVYHGDTWDSLRVTENCANALRRLRLEYKSRMLWIDAICINQGNVSERNQQVSIMTLIYSHAKRVIIYIGEKEPRGDTGQGDSEIKQICERPYFSRIWVVQEIASAFDKLVVCGSKSWAWDDFFPSALEEATDGLWLRHFYQPRIRDGSQLLQLLLDTATFQASDKRDRVFALFGLIVGPSATGLVADYSLDLDHVFIGVTSYLLTHFSNVASWDVLWLASLNIRPRHLEPSWVPDWSNICRRGLPRQNDWQPLLPQLSNLPNQNEVFISKYTGSLGLRGFRIASGKDLTLLKGSRHLYTAKDPNTNRVVQIRTKEFKFEPNDSFYYLPFFEFSIIIRSEQPIHTGVSGRLFGLCEISIPPNVRHLTSPTSKPNGEEMPDFHTWRAAEAYTASRGISHWIRGLLQSGFRPELSLDQFTQAWDRFVLAWANVDDARLQNRRRRVRMLFRKAVIHYQTRRLLNLMDISREKLINQRRSDGKFSRISILDIEDVESQGGHKSVLSRAVRFQLDQLVLFLQDRKVAITESRFASLGNLLWYLCMKSWPGNSAEPSSDIEAAILFLNPVAQNANDGSSVRSASFRQALLQLLKVPELESIGLFQSQKRKHESCGIHGSYIQVTVLFVDFITAFVADQLRQGVTGGLQQRNLASFLLSSGEPMDIASLRRRYVERLARLAEANEPSDDDAIASANWEFIGFEAAELLSSNSGIHSIFRDTEQNLKNLANADFPRGIFPYYSFHPELDYLLRVRGWDFCADDLVDFQIV